MGECGVAMPKGPFEALNAAESVLEEKHDDLQRQMAALNEKISFCHKKRNEAHQAAKDDSCWCLKD